MPKMLILSCFRQLVTRPIRAFSSSSVKKSISKLGFGNTQMPDKLYKTLELETRSYERAVLKSYEVFIKTAAEHLNINIEKIFSSEKPSYQRFTVLKSVHIYRKHLVQYEIRTYYTWFHLSKLTGSTADTFLEYIERMLPEGVALKVTKVSVEPLPAHLNSGSLLEPYKKVSCNKEDTV